MWVFFSHPGCQDASICATLALTSFWTKPLPEPTHQLPETSVCVWLDSNKHSLYVVHPRESMVSTFNPEIVGLCANVSNKREDIFFSFINESMTAMIAGELGVQGHFGWKMKRRLIIVLWLTCYLPVLLTFFCPRLEEELSRDFVISPLKLKFRLLLNYYFLSHTNSFKIWWWKRRLLNQISNLMPITIFSTFSCTLIFCSPPGSMSHPGQCSTVHVSPNQ